VEKELDCGMEAVVDGSAGKVIVSPDGEMRAYYGKKIENIRKKKAVCEVGRELPPRTKGGQRITLKLNISTPGELSAVTDLPHDGIGLLRTEFLFMQRQRPPTEDEQFQVYRDILCRDGARPVTVRLLDIGGDKLPPYLKLPEGVNTDLELRGAMAVDTFPELYETQLRALLRANPGNLKLLYPMVSDLSDLATFRQAVAQARKNLKEERVEFREGKIPEGIMIETPAAVMLARELLSEVDFINIGTNDLLQYTLAASRGSALGEKRYHILHPALLKLIEIAAREAKKAKKEVCLCGEIGSFEEFYPVLLETGLSSFSVAASKFTDIKCELMHLRRRRGSALREKLYKTKTKEEADVYFREFVE
jgi:Phosphoenolpyruvate-protein kinase (PTS system EI component in bacteria)